VNAYAEPLVSLDLDIVIKAEYLERVEPLCREVFFVERFPCSINLSKLNQTCAFKFRPILCISAFPSMLLGEAFLGVILPVARVEDVLQGKIWAISDPSQRTSKRQKDLADVAGLWGGVSSSARSVPSGIL